MSANPFNKSGVRLVATVPGKEKVVAMTTHRNMVIVATPTCVYRLAPRRKGKFKLVPIEFQEAA